MNRRTDWDDLSELHSVELALLGLALWVGLVAGDIVDSARRAWRAIW